MKTLKNRIRVQISLVVVLILFTINVEAQKKIEFGLRYMPSLSSFEMNTSSGGTVKGEATLGYGIGSFLAFNFTEHFSLQGEVIYSSISQKYSEADVERTVNLKYINVPLLVSLNTRKSGPVNLNLVFGPQLGFNVGSSVNTTGGDGTYTSQAVVSVKKSDIGFAYGLGIDFGLDPSGTLRLGLGYRAVRGLIDISDDNKTMTTESYYVLDKSKIKTNSLYIGLSILL